ncbi:MAG: 50S ribosomal protein L21 [Planctomycetia bacterium]|nr:50S ribosomal protein L21 [Planctomycetia bacterium]
MYAIIEDGSRQTRVQQGETIQVALRDAEPGKTIEFDRVLLVSDDSGTVVGTPTVEGASVEAEVIGIVKGPKLYILKLRRRQASDTRTGHRQHMLAVRIKKIKVNKEVGDKD